MPSPSHGKSRDEIAEAYDSPPWWYDIRGLLILTFAYNSTVLHQLRFFAPNVGPRHLEIACGTGTLLELILRWRSWKRCPHSTVVGIDYAEPMLAGARRRFASRSDVTIRHADAAALPFGPDSFDTVTIANAVHCLPDLPGALREVMRVMRPGGTLAANVLLYPEGGWPLRPIADRINRWGMRKGILCRPYQHEEIRQHWLGAGFEIASTGRSGNCFDILARKPG